MKLSAAVRRSCGTVADAVGQCVVVFAFLPPLTGLLRFFAIEADNSLNLQDPIVLAFVPVRALFVLLDSFAVGLLPRCMTGVLHGAFVSAWLLAYGGAITRRQSLVVGASSGALAAAVILAAEALGSFAAEPMGSRTVVVQILFGIGCGIVATVGTVRRLQVQDPGKASAAQE